MSLCFKKFKIHLLSQKLNMILKFTADKIGDIKRKYAFIIFVKNLNLNFAKIKKLNKNFLLKKHFLTFFKKTCEKMLNKQKDKNKMNDIIEYHNFHLKSKLFKNLKYAVEISQSENGKLLRKKLFKRILFKNLKELYEYNKKKNIFYRKLHLKKHFVKKWKFIMFMKKNNNIAKLKFVSKFILNWRKALIKIKEEKINAVLKLSLLFEDLMSKTVILLTFLYLIFF